MSQAPDSTAVADSLLQRLEREMADMAGTQQPPTQARPRAALSSNPNISAIGDFRSSYTSLGKRRVEAFLNEVEVQIASVVDPYARAEFLFSFGKDLETGAIGIELEVATLTSLSLPYRLQISLGKFKPHVGKVNVLHPHYFNFIEFPRVIHNFFESEGMFMEGVAASWLVPNPFNFYQELIFEIGRASGEENASFVQGDGDRLLYAGHLKNAFDLAASATLEVGLSALTGPNEFGHATTIVGADLTYKWKPLQFNTYKSFTWQSELLLNKMKNGEGEDVKTYGGYSFVEYQIKRRWFVGAKYDYSGMPGKKDRIDQTGALLFRFQPTEFQILALEFRYVDRNYDRNFGQVMFRAIFGIGAHAAHAY
ncbi:MAG: hypothetical protein IIA50_04670 [Bacteroidetes bacterium]|nr:hypothetical protein [Bacteroidota bacterium]